MQPYVIAQGDYLLQLAHQYGFDADTVWQDPSNADLRKLRSNSNILFPGDVLYIPDQANKQPTFKSLTVGSSNNFVSQAPTLTMTIKFVSDDSSAFASRAYTIQELDQLTGLTTDGSGVATFPAPVTLTTATIVFTDTGESYAFSIGAMDPINTMSGIFMRLRNLGYISGSLQFDLRTASNNLDAMRTGLLALKASQQPSDPPPASDPAPESSPASGPSSGSDSASSSSAASSSAAPPGDSAPDSASTETPPPSSPPPSSSSGASDDSGLADDGTLDDPTTALLLKAYGC